MTLTFRVDGEPDSDNLASMPRCKIVSDQDLLDSYAKTNSVHKTGAEFGIHGSSVHERLQKLGASKPPNLFSDEDERRLRDEYLIYRNAGKLDVLAASMGRTKQFICRQARAIGLTDGKHARPYSGKWKHMSEEVAQVLMDDFKSSRLTLGRYCKAKGYGETGFWQTMTRYFGDEWEHVIESKTPKTSRYRRGRGFEYSTRNDLRKRGYFVMRSPASRSPVDLVAIKQGSVLFIQCKLSGSLPPKEWNEIYDLAVGVGATAVMSQRHAVRRISYHKMIDRKDGSKRQQPMEDFSP